MKPGDEEKTWVSFNTSNIDDKEIEDFFVGLSEVNQDVTKKVRYRDD